MYSRCSEILYVHIHAAQISQDPFVMTDRGVATLKSHLLTKGTVALQASIRTNTHLNADTYSTTLAVENLPS